MPNFIDRRLNPKDKSLGNRQRFLRRAREELKRTIKEQIRAGKIVDVDAEHAVPMPATARASQLRTARDTGRREHVLPGNKEFAPGDRIPKPGQGGGGGGRGRRRRRNSRTISASCCRARRCSICSSRIWNCPTWSSST